MAGVGVGELILPQLLQKKIPVSVAAATSTLVVTLTVASCAGKRLVSHVIFSLSSPSARALLILRTLYRSSSVSVNKCWWIVRSSLVVGRVYDSRGRHWGTTCCGIAGNMMPWDILFGCLLYLICRSCFRVEGSSHSSS